MLSKFIFIAIFIAASVWGGDLRAAPQINAESAPVLALEKPVFPPTRARYAALAEQTEQNLQSHVLDKWFPAAVNRESGGFDQNFAADWSKLPGEERSIVYQSRLTWTAAQAALHRPAQEFLYRGFARHGAEFLRAQMWDAQNGGFFWQIERGVAQSDGEKHAYGNAFAIYALSAAFRATRDPEALRLAQQTFWLLDQNAHDARNGGYFEALRRDGTPILAPPAPDRNEDLIGTGYGFKSMNTHIHLLEAYSALYQIWPDAQLKARLTELFELVRDRIHVEPGALNLYFTPDWRPLPDHDSYGHDIETAYLLNEAAHILGRQGETKTRRAVRALVDHTLNIAFDADNGGIFDGGGVFGGITKSDKVWWAQAEALNAFLMMHELYGNGPDADRRYWDAFLQQWEFIREHQIDPVNGGWYSLVSKEGVAPVGRVKSNRWTESYHQARALINVTQTLRRLQAQSQ